jgi:hypothetical protein
LLKITLVIAASTLLACGAPPHDTSGDIYYDPCEPIVLLPGDATTASQRAGITAAISMWRDVGLQSLTLDPEGGTQRIPIHFKEAVGLLHGFYEPSNGEVRINTTVRDRALDVTIAHEVGHALGLLHIPDSERASLMNPTNETVAPTQDDERQLQKRWSCLTKP